MVRLAVADIGSDALARTVFTSGSLTITPSRVTRWLASRCPLALTCVAAG
jgi:hypothetical protein